MALFADFINRYAREDGELDQSVVEELLRDRVDFFNKAMEIPAAQIDYSPLQIVAKTPLSKAYFIFSLLSPGAVYVTDAGVLIGVLTKVLFVFFLFFFFFLCFSYFSKDILIRHAANTAK